MCQNLAVKVGHETLSAVHKLGIATIFLLSSLIGKPRGWASLRDLVKQLYFVGVSSLSIIFVAGVFIGMVLGLQGYTILVRFGADQALGQLIALSLVRELGPVIGALLFAGRAGSALTAEIALMKTTEQLSSMEMMGVDPLRRVIAPRFWAGLISLPMLALIFTLVAVYGGHFVGVTWLGVDDGAFWANMQSSVDFREDIINGLIKSTVFAFVVTWIAVYQGYFAKPTAEGIGLATTQTVVYASLAVLGLDFFLTAVMFGGF